MKIGYNPSSMEAYNSMLKTGRGMQASSAHLSTGIKINKTSQNAAGLAISNSLRTQAEGVEKAGQNTSNAISVLQTIDGSLNEMHNILQRIRELAVQAGNDTNEDSDRENLQLEIDELSNELNAMSDRCEYNRMKLLSGGQQDTAGGDSLDLLLVFHTGANKGYNMKVTIPETSGISLGVYTQASYPDGTNPVDIVSSQESRIYALTVADEAVDRVAGLRATIGGYVNRLEHTVNYLDASSEATRTSLSRIYDTDMALEMSNYSRLQVLTQTAMSIMSQANQTPQNVLQLLQ